MSINVEDSQHQTAALLLGGILGDLQQLVEQQFQLTRQEIEEEFKLRAVASGIFALGAGIVLLSALMLSLALSHCLYWIASPPGIEQAWIPIWICHLIVALVLAVSGGILIQIGRVKFNSVKRCPSPVDEILQENLL